MKNWPKDFPRYNDLYQESNRSNPENYFNRYKQFADLLTIHGLSKKDQEYFEWWEQRLERLDTAAWKQLKERTTPYICKRHDQRGWSQLLDHLNEALGYVLLADRGYTNIRFIDPKHDETPDLEGDAEDSHAFVEVKTVNCSDDDIAWINGPPIARQMGYGLTDKLKKKLEETINKARCQLMSHGNPVDKRIVLLIIELDSSYRFVGYNYTELKEFFATNQTPDVEVTHPGCLK